MFTKHTIMDNSLYIIGNGFNLAHGMKTHYSDYKIFCEKQPSLYKELQLFYGDFLNREGINWWYQFEKNLGILDYEHVSASDNAFLAPNHLFTFLTNHIRISFAEWLNQVHIADVCKFNLDEEARYFTFNYTDVLEQLYHIPSSNICHIHGRLNNPIDSNNLIVGHNYLEKELFKNYVSRYPQSVGVSWDLVNQLLAKAAEGGKGVERIIDRNKEYFYSLSSVEIIICIGFSFNDFDMPYIKKIFESNRNRMGLLWHVYYYEREDDLRIRECLSSIGVDSYNISTKDVKGILY